MVPLREIFHFLGAWSQLNPPYFAQESSLDVSLPLNRNKNQVLEIGLVETYVPQHGYFWTFWRGNTSKQPPSDGFQTVLSSETRCFHNPYLFLLVYLSAGWLLLRNIQQTSCPWIFLKVHRLPKSNKRLPLQKCWGPKGVKLLLVPRDSVDQLIGVKTVDFCPPIFCGTKNTLRFPLFFKHQRFLHSASLLDHSKTHKKKSFKPTFLGDIFDRVRAKKVWLMFLLNRVHQWK